MKEIEMIKRSNKLANEIGKLLQKQSKVNKLEFLYVTFSALESTLMAHICSVSKNTKENRLRILKEIFNRLEAALSDERLETFLQNRNVRIEI